MTIYETHKDVWDHLAKTGFSSLAELAKLFSRATELGVAIGMSGSAVSHWQVGRCRPSMQIEAKAREVFNSMKKPFSFADAQSAQASLPIDMPAPTPVATPAPVKSASDVVMLLVICPSAAAAKVQKVLGFLGCDTTEV